MEYFLGIVKELLTESANITTVSGAIRKRCESLITYEPEDGQGGGERIIQPVAYGLSKAGNLVVRAFQPYGDTKTKIPHWKMFRLDKITSWKTIWNRKFDEPPGTYNAEGKFNPNGDNSMSEVYLVANFERSKDYYSGKRAQGLYKYNQDRTKKKEEETPLYKLKQNIDKSVKSKEVLDRINKYPSKYGNDYVNGNERYIDDMQRVDSIPQTSQQVNEPINKTNVKQNSVNTDVPKNITYSSPQVKNDNNDDENIEKNGL